MIVNKEQWEDVLIEAPVWLMITHNQRVDDMMLC